MLFPLVFSQLSPILRHLFHSQPAPLGSSCSVGARISQGYKILASLPNPQKPGYPSMSHSTLGLLLFPASSWEHWLLDQPYHWAAK